MQSDGSSFPIYELNWVGGGGSQSKKDRIQRLEPDLKDGSFFFPYPTDEKRLTSHQKDKKIKKIFFKSPVQTRTEKKSNRPFRPALKKKIKPSVQTCFDFFFKAGRY